MENEPAFPFKWENRDGGIDIEQGLTKREYFAAMALQGVMANGKIYGGYNAHDAAKKAKEVADELLKQLKGGSNG